MTTEPQKPKLSEEMQAARQEAFPCPADGQTYVVEESSKHWHNGYREGIDDFIGKVQAMEAEIDALKKQNERLKQACDKLRASGGSYELCQAIYDGYKAEGLLK